MQFDIVFALGPSEKMNPLPPPKFALPFLNVSLLNLSMNYLVPFASKVFFVCLDEHVPEVLQLVKGYNIPMEIIKTPLYEGMAHILNIVVPKITTEYFILSKGDIYGLEPLRPLLEGFLQTKDDLYVSVYKTLTNSSKVMSIDTENRLLGYFNDEIPIVRTGQVRVTTEFFIKDFFVAKTRSIPKLNEKLFSFKNNIIPQLIKENRAVRIGHNMVFQIQTFNEYIRQIDFKNRILGSLEETEYNLIDPKCKINKNALIENSVIGANVMIGNGTQVRRTIVMAGARLCDGCLYENCIVDGHNNVYKF